MKNQASTFLKQVFSSVATIVKAKSMAMKSKTSAMKTRLLVFGMLRNKKVLMSAISHKIHALIGDLEAEDDNKAIVLHKAKIEARTVPASRIEDYDDYLDLGRSLFNLDDEEDHDDDVLGNRTGSVIDDLVRNSREDGANFILEDEIDRAADVYIRRFHKQMRMQKQESFKRYQEMVERSA